jgi:hypothetical protein
MNFKAYTIGYPHISSISPYPLIFLFSAGFLGAINAG